MDNVARSALNGILRQSIESRKEWGGMIYVLNGQVMAMPPRTQGEPHKVDVGQHEPNCSCPHGATPVAYYHTHPLASFAGLPAKYNEFSPEDLAVVTDYNLEAAYLGSLDGSFFKYDRKIPKPFRLGGRLRNTN